MLTIGVLAARLLGNVLASMENTRYLGYLHMELDPKKFLEHYREVPGRMKRESANRMDAFIRSVREAGQAPAPEAEH